MRRKLFSAASLLSLLLCMSSAVLWLGGRSHSVRFQFWTSRGLCEAVLDSGRVVFDNAPQHELDLEPVRRLGQQESAARERVPQIEHELNAAWDADHMNEAKAADRERHWTLATSVAANRAQLHYLTRGMTTPVYFSLRLRLAVAITAVLPCLLVMFRVVGSYHRRSRINRRLCPICGYNLIGNTSGVCPECGTTISGKGEA